MAGSAKRERQLAREHYERQQARRAARAAKQRRTKQVAAVVVAVLVLAAGVVGLSVALAATTRSRPPSPRPRRRATPSATETPSPSASATPGAGCIYTKAGEASKDVGLPAYDASKAASYRKPFTADRQDRPGRHRHRDGRRQGALHHQQLPPPGDGRSYYDGTSCHRLTTGQHLRAAVR